MGSNPKSIPAQITPQTDIREVIASLRPSHPNRFSDNMADTAIQDADVKISVAEALRTTGHMIQTSRTLTQTTDWDQKTCIICNQEIDPDRREAIKEHYGVLPFTCITCQKGLEDGNGKRRAKRR